MAFYEVIQLSKAEKQINQKQQITQRMVPGGRVQRLESCVRVQGKQGCGDEKGTRAEGPEQGWRGGAPPGPPHGLGRRDVEVTGGGSCSGHVYSLRTQLPSRTWGSELRVPGALASPTNR